MVAGPSPDEVPEVIFPQSTYPVSVGVLGAKREPVVNWLPEFKPGQLTAEEQKILDKGKPKKIDFLALYPGKPRENILPERGGPAVGVIPIRDVNVTNIPAMASATGIDKQPLVGYSPGRHAVGAPMARIPAAGAIDAHKIRPGIVPVHRRSTHENTIEND